MQRPDDNDKETTNKQVTQEPLITPQIPPIEDCCLSTEQQRWLLCASADILPVASVEPCNKKMIRINSGANSNHVYPKKGALSRGRADGDWNSDYC